MYLVDRRSRLSTILSISPSASRFLQTRVNYYSKSYYLGQRNEVMFLSLSVVCLFTRLLKTLWTDFGEFFEGWGVILVAIRITIQILEFLKWFFIYYCDSDKQPRIKHENSRRRFELCEWNILVLFTVFICDGTTARHMHHSSAFNVICDKQLKPCV